MVAIYNRKVSLKECHNSNVLDSKSYHKIIESSFIMNFEQEKYISIYAIDSFWFVVNKKQFIHNWLINRQSSVRWEILHIL